MDTLLKNLAHFRCTVGFGRNRLVFAGREGVDKLIHTVLRPTLDDFVAFQVGVDTTDLLVINFYIDCAYDFKGFL